MNAKEITRYLFLVGQELEAANVQEPIELLLIGGGYMLTQIRGSRKATGDVDAVWVQEVYSDSDIYWNLQEAILAVANTERLDLRWMNMDGSGFVHQAGPLPKMKLWKQFGPMFIYLPPKDFILAHKLVAGRKKDRADIEFLCAQLRINTRKKAQKVLDKYIGRYYQDTGHAAETLDAIFGQ